MAPPRIEDSVASSTNNIPLNIGQPEKNTSTVDEKKITEIVKKVLEELKQPTPHTPFFPPSADALTLDKRNIAPTTSDLTFNQLNPQRTRKALHDELDLAPFSSVSKKPLRAFLLEVYASQIETAEGRIRDYAEEMDKRNAIIKDLDALKSHLRANKDGVDWKKEVDFAEQLDLLEKAKGYGLVVPGGQDSKKWSKEQKEAMLTNLDTLTTNQQSSNDKARLTLGFHQNNHGRLVTEYTNLESRMQDAHMAIARNLATR